MKKIEIPSKLNFTQPKNDEEMLREFYRFIAEYFDLPINLNNYREFLIKKFIE